MSLGRRVFWIKLLTILALIALWEGLSWSGLFYKGVLPSTWTVAQAIAGELVDRSFYHDLGITMLESSVGFVAGAIIALLFAVVLGTNSYIRKMIEPYLVAIGGTPKIIFRRSCSLSSAWASNPRWPRRPCRRFSPWC
jgi:NitT/TauT family transport system permease protein